MYWEILPSNVTTIGVFLLRTKTAFGFDGAVVIEVVVAVVVGIQMGFEQSIQPF